MNGLFKKWGKQVAVRFEPDELAKLDELLLLLEREKREQHGGYYWRPLTRSEVIRSVVVAAHARAKNAERAEKAQDEARKKGAKKKPTKKGGR